MVTYSSLVVLTPVKQSPSHNIVRIHREMEILEDRLLHVAGGEHTGIIVNKLTAELPDDGKTSVELSFSVWMRNGGENKEKTQEKRSLRFRLSDDVTEAEGRGIVHTLFRTIMTHMPPDYVSFLKCMLKLLQRDYLEVSRVDVEFELVDQDAQIPIPDAAQYESSSEVEEVTVGHVQDVLEHAFPNGLSVTHIAEALRCTEEDVLAFMKELENSGIVRRVGDSEWIRVDQKGVDAALRNQTTFSHTSEPTIAIITCLFSEKQAVDAIIDDAQVIHKYKSGGDSNLYTTGKIGCHNVVATKLAVIGDTREAFTSAGSITTRLLGNFQHIEHVFVVGVGGGVPHYTDAAQHTRLGDVVVSYGLPNSYIYCHDLILDRKTEILSGFAVRRYQPCENRIPSVILDGGETLRQQWQQRCDDIVSKLNMQGPEADFSVPSPETDLLTMQVGGGNLVVLPHPNQETRKGFELHVGRVGGMANMKKMTVDGEEDLSAQTRQRFASEFGLRAVDVGFDSVVAAITGSRIDSWALIRGVADYQHGHSKAARKWQAHAAVRAAAATRAIIEQLA